MKQPFLVIPDPLELLRVSDQHGAPKDCVIIGGSGGVGADDALVVVVDGPRAKHVVEGGVGWGQGKRGGDGTGGGERLGEVARWVDVARGERVG